jgi:hypothetical protein
MLAVTHIIERRILGLLVRKYWESNRIKLKYFSITLLEGWPDEKMKTLSRHRRYKGPIFGPGASGIREE